MDGAGLTVTEGNGVGKQVTQARRKRFSAESGAITLLTRERLILLAVTSLGRKAKNRPLWLRCRTPRCSWTTKRPGDLRIDGAQLLRGAL
jgi:hypothetical protein